MNDGSCEYPNNGDYSLNFDGIDRIDIENSNTLMERYHLRIPVVKYKNQTLFQYHLNSSVIKKILKSSSGE